MTKYVRLFPYIAAVSSLMLVSCVKQHIDTDLDQKLKFDWDLTETKTVFHEGSYDVFNQDGDTIAVALSGSNALFVAEGDELTVVPSATVQTKAGTTSTIYFPADKEYASYWCEDLFPAKGDMDFNDVVFGARYVFKITDGYVTSLKIDTYFQACGSAFDLLGVAIQLDGVAPESVSSNGGYYKNDFSKLFSVNRDYIETGNDYAVIPLVGDFRNTFSGGRQSGMVNTFNKFPFFNTRNQASITVRFNVDISYEDLYAAINPFVIIGERSKEIHMKGRTVTSKFDSSKYPTNFVSNDGFVWMMMIPKRRIYYPQEMVSIYDAFPQFEEWVFKSEQSKYDWYMFPNEEYTYKQNY